MQNNNQACKKKHQAYQQDRRTGFEDYVTKNVNSSTDVKLDLHNYRNPVASTATETNATSKAITCACNVHTYTHTIAIRGLGSRSNPFLKCPPLGRRSRLCDSVACSLVHCSKDACAEEAIPAHTEKKWTTSLTTGSLSINIATYKAKTYWRALLHVPGEWPRIFGTRHSKALESANNLLSKLQGRMSTAEKTEC